MSRDVRGIEACLIAPIVATAIGPIVYFGIMLSREIWSGGLGIKSWYWRELLESYQIVAVIFLPTLLISYLLFHFILRPHIGGRYKNPCKSLALGGGGLLTLLFLIVLTVVGVTCSSDQWVNTEFISSLLERKAITLLALSVPAISSIVLGFLAGVFLPRNILLPETDQTPGPIGKRLILSSLTLIFLLCAIWGPLFFQWQRGADRSGCIMNIRNVQQAMRGYQGMNSSEQAPKEKLIGPGRFIEREPVCPRGGKYTWTQVGWHVGELMIRCSHKDHIPNDYRDW
jgi:hypothetical protein